MWPDNRMEGPMKYGVVLPIWQLTVAEAESLATKAEALGLDGVFVPDHILAKPATTQHYGGHWPDPFSLLAFLAGRTRRIQLGASVIVLPYRNPLVAAKAAATVDPASGGRFIFVVGVGWDEAEFVDLRLPFAERGRLSDDYIRAIKAAFGADIPQYTGKYTSFPRRPPPPAPGAAPAPADLGRRLARRDLGPRGPALRGAGRRGAPARPRPRRYREGLRGPAGSGRPHRAPRQAGPLPAQHAGPERFRQGRRPRPVPGLGGRGRGRHQARAGHGRRVDDLRSPAGRHPRDDARDGAPGPPGT